MPKGDGLESRLREAGETGWPSQMLGVNEQWRFGYAWVLGVATSGSLSVKETRWHTASCISLRALRRSSTTHPWRIGLPKGQTFHAAGPSAGGWTVIAIHESKESWERFRDDILMPTLQKGVKGGFIAPPQEQAFEVYNLRP